MTEIIGRDEWNAAVALRHGMFLQSWEWGELQEALGRKIVRMQTARSLALCIEYPLPRNMRYVYAPRSPLLAEISSGALAECLAEIKKHTEGISPLFLRIEPSLENTGQNIELLKRAGLKKVAPHQPDTSRIIALTASKDDILSAMEAETRYAIRAAERRGVIIRILRTAEEKEKNFEAFWELFEETNRRRGLARHDKAYYRGVALLGGECHSEMFLAEHEGVVIAGAIFVYFAGRAEYLYAATRSGFGRLNAPTLIIWNAILRAKEKGCTIFDMWGISHTNERWRGVTAFKKGFGGKEVATVGTWELPLRRGMYFLYSAARKIIKKRSQNYA